jgi:hypothetical protein
MIGVRQGFLRHSAADNWTATEGEPKRRDGWEQRKPPAEVAAHSRTTRPALSRRFSANRKLTVAGLVLRGKPSGPVARERNISAARPST